MEEPLCTHKIPCRTIFKTTSIICKAKSAAPAPLPTTCAIFAPLPPGSTANPSTKVSVSRWKDHLLERGYLPATINGMLASLHGYFRYREWDHCRVRYLRVQRKLFRDDNRALSRWEYQKLLRAARARGWRRIALVVETIGATGIRVSELSAITAESVARGRADIHLKGKIRTILIPSKLCKKLTHYARLKKIAHGEIFLNATENP